MLGIFNNFLTSSETMQHKSVIFVVISFLVISLLYSPLSSFEVNALPPDPNYQGGTCSGISTNKNTGQLDRTCCWTQTKEGSKGVFKPRAKYCQTCSADSEGKFTNCGQKRIAEVVADAPPTSPPTEPSGPFTLPEDGVLQELPSQGGEAQPPIGGQGVSPQGSLSQEQPTEQGTTELPSTEPATVEEEQSVPVCQEGLEFNEDLGFCVPTECPDGQELNDETGICVLEEQPAEQQEQAADEPEGQPTEEETSEQEESSEDNDNSNN